MYDALNRLDRIPKYVLKAVRRVYSDDLIVSMSPKRLFVEYCVISHGFYNGDILWLRAMELKKLEDELSLELVNHYQENEND
jgi:hypothetical protein